MSRGGERQPKNNYIFKSASLTMETDSACVEIITFVSNINTSQYTNCSQLLKLCRLRVVYYFIFAKLLHEKPKHAGGESRDKRWCVIALAEIRT